MKKAIIVIILAGKHHGHSCLVIFITGVAIFYHAGSFCGVGVLVYCTHSSWNRLGPVRHTDTIRYVLSSFYRS